MNAPIAVSVTMHVRCAKCSSSIHLGALVERARCPSCAHIESLPASRWVEFLDAAVHDAPRTRPDADITRDVSEAWVVAQRSNLRCTSCTTPLPRAAENVKTHGRCFCVACGTKLSVRAVPAHLSAALPRITHVIGEDIGQLKSPDAPPPDVARSVAVPCPECGGKISPDGSSRAVRCPYCSVAVVLHQAIWRRFASGPETHAFYLLHDPSLPRPLGRADVQWESIESVACDPAGNLYGLAENDVVGSEGRIIFALDPQLRTRWVNTVSISDDGQLALRDDGTLFAWSPRRHSALVFRAVDGQELGKIGQEQPEGLDRHVLDLQYAHSLAMDLDGSFLVSKGNRLARCGPDGGGVRTWPPRSGLLGGLFDDDKVRPYAKDDEEDAVYVENAGDYPTKLRGCRVRVGFDGRVYLKHHEHVVVFERSGKKRFAVQLPEGSGDYDYGIDGRGFVYALRQIARSTHGVYRIAPDGRCDLFVDGRNPQTPLRHEGHLAVRPDGALFAFAYGRSLRVFGPDGRLLHRTPQAEKNDARFAEEAHERRERDEGD